MKVSYSKVLVHGVIATTLLMAMSCQKKGTARALQPQTATPAEKPEADIKIEEPKLEKVPGKSEETVVKGRGKAAEPTVAGKTSEDSTLADPPVVKTEKTPDKAAPTVKNKINVSPTACPESIVNATNAMTTLFKKIKDEEKVLTTPVADKITDYKAYLKLCLAWPKLFTTEKIESCGGYVNIGESLTNLSFSAKSANIGCGKIALAAKELTGQHNEISAEAARVQAEKMKNLRAEKFVVSDDGKQMFSTGNANWDMYIMDGELQTDHDKLTDGLNAKKVACTMTKSATDNFTQDQKVIVSITTASALEVNDHADKLRSGVLFGLRVKATDKNATAEEAAKVPDQISEMYCMNLDVKDINLKDLKKALGQHIAVEANIMNPPTAANTKVVETKK